MGPIKSISLVRAPIASKKGSINNEATPAIGFAYLSGYLRKFGYKPVWIDGIGEGLNQFWPLEKYPGFSAQGLNFDEIIARIPKDSQVIGFSVMFSGEWPLVRDLIMEVRKHFPNALFVGGGEHLTALAEFSLKDCPALDVCVRGEGEHVFLELIKKYEETGDFKGVNGTSYLNEEQIFCQDEGLPPRIRNIDAIGWPYWPEGHLANFWKFGKSLGIASERDMPFLASRGCPYECTFCSNPTMWTTRYLLRNVDDVVNEIQHYIKRFGVTNIQFYDLTAIVKKSWVIDFCKKLIQEKININWSLPTGTRTEALDRETLGLLKQTGCNYLVYAPESGSPRTLEKIKKKINLDKLTELALEAKRQNLTIRTNLIVGFPDETWSDIFKTFYYGFSLAVRGVDEVPYYIFSPYPGTELFRRLQGEKEVILTDKYFLALTSLNSAYLSTEIISFNPNVNKRLLVSLRTFLMIINYTVGYLLYPKRIYRTFKNIFTSQAAATVLEHRLKDLLQKKLKIGSFTNH